MMRYLLCYRYANMDYLLLSTVAKEDVDEIFLTYDLACQYSIHFKKRVESYPPQLQVDFSAKKFRYAIPKKHWLVHGPNHSHFSLNYIEKVGRTYGEGIEAGWSHIGPISLSTREMAPATRHEAID